MHSQSLKLQIRFFYPSINVDLRHRNRLKNYIRSILKKEGRKKIKFINYIFCSDKELLRINQKYLGHDFYTDVITFEFSENEIARAEIYVSIDRVKENARKFGVSYTSEVHRIVFHGTLHLCGYKDKNKVDKAIMKEKEELFLSNYFNCRFP